MNSIPTKLKCVKLFNLCTLFSEYIIFNALKPLSGEGFYAIQLLFLDQWVKFLNIESLLNINVFKFAVFTLCTIDYDT